MNKYLLYMFLMFTIQQFHSQESNGVVALALPVRNSLKFNRYAINSTFSFVREQNKFISFTNKKQWAQFQDGPQSYFFSYSGRFAENIGAGVGLFQQDFGVFTTFGGMLNFAYNANISRENNLTFGLNIGAYQSSLNQGRVVVNTPDPSLQNVTSNFLISINPGINYGTGFLDLGVSINNLVSYNLTDSKIIEDNPEQALQAHVMYTGYMNSRGFFDESRFSTLIRSEFKKEQTVISGIAMLNVPKGIWAQAGYNTLYGASAGIGVNVTNNIALEYNYEQSIGNFSEFGSSHEITLAYRFKKNYRYNYGDEDEEQSVFNTNKRRRKPNNLTDEDRTRIAERRAQIAAKREAEAAAQKVQAGVPNSPKNSENNDTVAATQAEKNDVAEEEENGLRLEEEAKLKLQEAERKRADEKAKIKAENEARKKQELEQQKKKEEEAKLRAEEERRIKLEAEKKAQEAQEKAEAKRKAEEAEKLRLEEERRKIEAEEKIKAQEEAKQKLEAEKAKAEAARLKLEAEQKAEELRKKTEAEENARLEQERLKAEAEAKEAEKKRLEQEAAEAKAKEEQEREAAEAAKLKAEEEARLKAEAEAEKIRLEEETKAKLEAENVAIEEESPIADDKASQTMQALVNETKSAKQAQDELIKRLSERIDVKQKDLDDLKEENDLSEQGIYLAPKPFKSLSEENAAIATLKDELERVEKEQEVKMIELEAILIKRKRKFKKDSEGINDFYLNALEGLRADQLRIKNTKESLVSNLERINVDTDFERKRRIRRAAYDNQEDRYNKDKAALARIKKFTDESTVPLKEEDFDFGEEQTKNIQIVKNVLNEEPGYYMVIAVHNSVEKRDEFVSKVVASGEKNVNFFFDVKTNKYFIYYEKFDSISQAKDALDTKGSKPYNGKMSLVKIDN